MPLYSPLPKGSVRLLRLLPSSDEISRIECQLITLPLLGSGSTHPYEALSYVWGPEDNNQLISIDGSKELLVTANLHVALLHLRHCFLERILWIDAICINQKDNDEKGQQVRSMANIYARASRVIVWLGEAADNSHRALEVILEIAGGQSTDTASDESNEQVLTLLERPWFQRIWVVQEVAAARHVLVMCGATEIDGYAFCMGLSALNLSYETQPHLLGIIAPIAYLIRRAAFRPRYERPTTERGSKMQPARESLNIRPLSELLDMYHTRKATVPLDKIYALLGMCSDDPSTAELEIDYTASWGEVFRKLIRFSLSDQVSVRTWDDVEVAVIKAKGHVLGEVSSVGEDDATLDGRQDVDIAWRNVQGRSDAEEKQSSRFTSQPSAKAVREGDIVYILQGAAGPTIVRPCDGTATIIMIALPPTDDLRKRSASITAFPHNIVLIWDWDGSQTKWQGSKDYAVFLNSRGIPECVVPRCQCPGRLDKATRLWNFGLFLNRVERYGEAIKNMRNGLDIYRAVKALRGVDHSPCREEDNEVLRIMSDLLIDEKDVIMEAAYEDRGQTPLSWAAKEGLVAFAKLLIEKGAATEAKDKETDLTPLWYSAANGHETILQLLLEAGADTEAKDEEGRTPLSWFAEIGDEALVRLLLGTGKADVNAKDSSGRTPLFWAAMRGHTVVVELLLATGNANIDSRDRDGQTARLQAVKKGYMGIFERLNAARMADKDVKDQDDIWRLLSSADENQREELIQKMLDAKKASLSRS